MNDVSTSISHLLCIHYICERIVNYSHSIEGETEPRGKKTDHIHG